MLLFHVHDELQADDECCGRRRIQIRKDTYSSLFLSGHARWSSKFDENDRRLDDGESLSAYAAFPIAPCRLKEPAASTTRAADGTTSEKLAKSAPTLDFRPPFHVSVSSFPGPAIYFRCSVDQPQSLSTQHKTIIPVLSYLRTPLTSPGRLQYNHAQYN
jgi:hypothetical protein